MSKMTKQSNQTDQMHKDGCCADCLLNDVQNSGVSGIKMMVRVQITEHLKRYYLQYRKCLPEFAKYKKG